MLLLRTFGIALLLLLAQAKLNEGSLTVAEGEDECSICRAVEPRIQQLFTQTSTDVDMEKILCGSSVSEACSNFLMTYGRVMVRRAFYGDQNICARLPSYSSLLAGSPSPVCASTQEDTTQEDTTQEGSRLSAVQQQPPPQQQTQSGLASLHTFIRVVVAMREANSNDQAATGNIGEALISRTDTVVKNGVDVWRKTQQMYLSLDNNGVVTSSVESVSIEQLIQGSSSEIAQALTLDSVQPATTGCNSWIIFAGVGVFLLLIMVVLLIISSRNAAQDDNEKNALSEEEELLMMMMMEAQPLPPKMQMVLPPVASPMAKEKDLIQF